MFVGFFLSLEVLNCVKDINCTFCFLYYKTKHVFIRVYWFKFFIIWFYPDKVKQQEYFIYFNYRYEMAFSFHLLEPIVVLWFTTSYTKEWELSNFDDLDAFTLEKVFFFLCSRAWLIIYHFIKVSVWSNVEVLCLYVYQDNKQNH